MGSKLCCNSDDLSCVLHQELRGAETWMISEIFPKNGISETFSPRTLLSRPDESTPGMLSLFETTKGLKGIVCAETEITRKFTNAIFSVLIFAFVSLSCHLKRLIKHRVIILTFHTGASFVCQCHHLVIIMPFNNRKDVLKKYSECLHDGGRP